MTTRERNLINDGYTYYDEAKTNDDAKQKAQVLRNSGKKACVVSESRRGVYYYSVWCKEA